MPGFERQYFDEAYGGQYERRNPRRKIEFYLDCVRRVKPSGKLFEAGCAYGLFLEAASRYFEVAGSDISAHAIEHASKRLEGVSQGRVEDVPLERNYDVIACFDVLEHVEDIDGVFKRLREALAPGGALAISVPVYDTIVGALVGRLDRDETHVWKESREFWRDRMAANGFRVSVDVGLWRYMLPCGHYMFFGGRVWRNFSPAILLVGSKA